jgi:hypothetical protein
VLAGARRWLNWLAQFSQHVFLIEPNVVPNNVWPGLADGGVPGTIAKRLANGKPIDDIAVTYERLAQKLGAVWLRHSGHTCERNATCTFIPVQQEFCNEVKCHLYDPETLFAARPRTTATSGTCLCTASGWWCPC